MQLDLRVSAEVKRWLRLLAIETGRTMQQIVAEAIAEKLAAEGAS